MRTADFDYHLPPEAIAQRPVEPRHDARLLDTRDLTDHRFLNLPLLLKPGDLLVVNRTRVRAARLRGQKRESGGAVEALLLRRLDDRWEAMVKPARRLRPGVELDFGPIRGRIVQGPVDGVVQLELVADDDPEEVIARIGELPLPPYIHGNLEDPERYQTIFSQKPGSTAAPTAGLHFTDQVLAHLGERHIELTSVDLEVGMDTFRPIEADHIESHPVHSERFDLGGECAQAIESARQREGRVVAVGTTSVRVLESCGKPDRTVNPSSGSTDLFITPGYRFQVVDALVTNFHMPRTTLIVMVAAIMGDRWRRAYTTALERGYRFLSFGDAMFVEMTR